MTRLIFLDTEWANNKNKSLCQIGLIGSETTINTYIDPDDGFDTLCVNVHGITPKTVKDSPTFKDVWPDLVPYLDDSVIVGHNVKGADLDAIRKNLSRYGMQMPVVKYADTREMARSALGSKFSGGYSLDSLCEYLNIERMSKHDALYDAKACMDLFNILQDRYGIDPDDHIKEYADDSVHHFSPYIVSPERELCQLMGSVKVISCSVTDEDLLEIDLWMDTHRLYLQDNTLIPIMESLMRFRDVPDERNAAELIVEIKDICGSGSTAHKIDELIGMMKGFSTSASESRYLLIREWLLENKGRNDPFPFDDAFEIFVKEDLEISSSTRSVEELLYKISDPTASGADPDVNICGTSFCLTGDFIHGSRSEITEYLESKGAIVHTSVKKTTDFVVMGDLGSQGYSHGSYGSKVEKALKYGVQIIREDLLYE